MTDTSKIRPGDGVYVKATFIRWGNNPRPGTGPVKRTAGIHIDNADIECWEDSIVHVEPRPFKAGDRVRLFLDRADRKTCGVIDSIRNGQAAVWCDAYGGVFFIRYLGGLERVE